MEAAQPADTGRMENDDQDPVEYGTEEHDGLTAHTARCSCGWEYSSFSLPGLKKVAAYHLAHNEAHIDGSEGA